MFERVQHSSALVVMLLVSALGSVAAQQPDSLSSGMRVRLKVTGLATVKGKVVSVGAKSFNFQHENARDTIVVDYDRIERMDVSRGLRHRVLHNAGLGSVAGLVVGGIIGAERHANFPNTANGGVAGCSAVDPECIHNGGYPPKDPTAVDAKRTAKGAAIGAAAGFVAGVVVGNILESEVWERLPTERYHVHVALFPVRLRGAGVRVSFGI